jgi:hypothetical protein
MREDRVGKIFIMVFTNGDLPENPMCLRECVVCGEFFTREESRKHTEIWCQPSPQQPIAIVTGRGSKSVHTRQTCQ